MNRFLTGVLDVRQEEAAPLAASTLFFFCVLTALMVLRPARDALGMRGSMDDIRWLFAGTAIATLGVNPAFGWLVSRFRRMTFIAATYGFFAVSLVGFYLLLTLAPQASGETSGMVFYVWFSVFNLFCTMVFWGLMADRFTLEQSRRLFGPIAVGGTLGAIAGPWLASLLARPLGTPALLLVSAGLLVLSIVAAWGVDHFSAVRPAMPLRDPESTPPSNVVGPAEEDPLAHEEEHEVIGGSPWQGVGEAFRSPYLLGISGYMLVLSVIATFLYFARLQVVAAAGENTDVRAQMLAQIDIITQVATLVLQLTATGPSLRWLGISRTLALLPALMVIGFVGLALHGTLAVLVILDVTFKAVQRAIMRPARETLFTTVSREDKYKSKAFTDTFVYRGGDLVGAWTEGLIGRLGMGLAGVAWVAVPLSAAWGILGVWLGHRQQADLQSRVPSAECD